MKHVSLAVLAVALALGWTANAHAGTTGVQSGTCEPLYQGVKQGQLACPVAVLQRSSGTGTYVDANGNRVSHGGRVVIGPNARVGSVHVSGPGARVYVGAVVPSR